MTDGDGKPLLRMAGITRQYPGVRALDGVDLELRAGEVVGLLGKNGAGKSTLIKVLAGLERPDAGTIEIDGEVQGRYDPRVAKDAGFHFIFQELEEFDDLTVAENVMIAAGLPKRGGLVSSGRLVRRAAELLEEVDCGVDPRSRMRDLSTVQRRMVMIARSLAGGGRLLVLDEPTASLTPREVDQVLALCKRLSRSGTAVLYVSHRLEEVMEITDRVVIFRDGATVHEADRADITIPVLVEHISGAAPREQVDPTARRLGRGPVEQTTPLLSVRGLGDGSKIEDISFDVQPGEILGIGGLVGAGRTELLTCLSGASRAASGTVLIDGKEQTLSSVRDGLDAGVVLLPEERRSQGLIGSYDIVENATISSLGSFRAARRLPWIRTRRERAAVEPLVERMAMRIGRLEQPASSLSGGTQQKLLTARALLNRPRILLMDEPTAGIDVGAKEEIYDLLDELAAEGRAIVVVSSDFAELATISDRVVVLSGGRQRATLSGTDVDEDTITRHCYVATEAVESSVDELAPAERGLA